MSRRRAWSACRADTGRATAIWSDSRRRCGGETGRGGGPLAGGAHPHERAPGGRAPARRRRARRAGAPAAGRGGGRGPSLRGTADVRARAPRARPRRDGRKRGCADAGARVGTRARRAQARGTARGTGDRPRPLPWQRRRRCGARALLRARRRLRGGRRTAIQPPADDPARPSGAARGATPSRVTPGVEAADSAAPIVSATGEARAPEVGVASAASGGGRGCGAEAELRCDRPHRLDHEADVLVEIHAELLGALVDVVTVHAGRERGLLELLPNRLRLERVDPVRADEAAGVDEPRELVAGEERLLELRVPRAAEVLSVREDGLDELLRIPLLAQDRRPVLGMLVERGVDLVVEVVEKRDRRPQLLVFPVLGRISPDSRLDRERVPQQRFALRVLRQRLPRLITGRLHRALG